jgi:hypothetical protein
MVIKLDSVGQTVLKWQQFLISKSYNIGSLDGIFGSKTWFCNWRGNDSTAELRIIMKQNLRVMFGVLFVSVMVGASVGCEAYPLVPPPTIDDGECIPSEVTRTRVPSVLHDGIDVMLICTQCDIDECNSLGARCEVDGLPCDFYGKLGVCSGCCDSEYGELHCALLAP